MRINKNRSNRKDINKVNLKKTPQSYKDCAALAGIGIVVAAVTLPAAVPGPALALAGPGSAAEVAAAPSTSCAARHCPSVRFLVLRDRQQTLHSFD